MLLIVSKNYELTSVIVINYINLKFVAKTVINSNNKREGIYF